MGAVDLDVGFAVADLVLHHASVPSAAQPAQAIPGDVDRLVYRAAQLDVSVVAQRVLDQWHDLGLRPAGHEHDVAEAEALLVDLVQHRQLLVGARRIPRELAA